MNKDEFEGKADQVKGRMKKGAANVTDNDQLREEGTADEASGDVQEGFGKARRKVGDAINDVGSKLKR